MEIRIVKVLSIVGLTMALAIISNISPPQSQVMLSEVNEQNQVMNKQTSPRGNATATITITWTTAPNPLG